MDDKEMRAGEAERWWQFSRDALTYAKDYGSSTIAALVTINGGAIIALLSFFAAADKGQLSVAKASISHSLIAYGVGLLLAVAAGGLGYINFSAVNGSLPSPNGLSRYVASGDVSGWTDRSKFINRSAILAVFLVSLSGVGFLCGSYSALSALMEYAS